MRRISFAEAERMAKTSSCSEEFILTLQAMGYSPDWIRENCK